MKKIFFYTLVFAFLLSSKADVKYWAGNSGVPGPEWNDPNHWTPKGVPASTDHVIVTSTVLPSPVISNNVGTVDILAPGWHNTGNISSLTITDGASIIANTLTRLGYEIDSQGEIIMQGGYHLSGRLELGYNDTNLTAGGSGYVLLTGNSVLHLVDLEFGQENLSYNPSDPDYDGTGLLEIRQLAQLIVNGDKTGTTGEGSDWLSSDYIIAYDDIWPVNMVYDQINNRTVFSVAPGLETGGTVWQGDCTGDQTEWMDPNNWNPGVPASGSGGVAFIRPKANMPVIDSPIIETANIIIADPDQGTAELTVNSGADIYVNGFLRLGHDIDSTGVIHMNGGDLKTEIMQVGFNSISETASGNGQVYLDGGTLEVLDWMSFGDNNPDFGQPGYDGTGNIDLTGGALVINGDQRINIENWFETGQISAFNGTGYIKYDYDITNPGKTTVTASQCPTMDFDGDCKVDLKDFALFSDKWLISTKP